MKVFQHHYIKLKDKETVKPGNIIISKGFWNDEIFQRSVILIIEHNERGSIGIIVNKESNLQVSEALPGIEVNDRLLYGGPVNTKMVAFIHGEKFLSKALRITNDIFWGGNIYQLQKLINNKEIPAHEIKFFAGYVEWKPGKLDEEVSANQWWVEKISLNELLEIKNYDLWASKLMQQDNIYGALYAVPDPCLN